MEHHEHEGLCAGCLARCRQPNCAGCVWHKPYPCPLATTASRRPRLRDVRPHGRVRSCPHPRTHPGRALGRPCSWAHRWPETGDDPRAINRSPAHVRRPTVHHGRNRHLLRRHPHDNLPPHSHLRHPRTLSAVSLAPVFTRSLLTATLLRKLHHEVSTGVLCPLICRTIIQLGRDSMIQFERLRFPFTPAPGGPRSDTRVAIFSGTVNNADCSINGFDIGFTQGEHPFI